MNSQNPSIHDPDRQLDRLIRAAQHEPVPEDAKDRAVARTLQRLAEISRAATSESATPPSVSRPISAGEGEQKLVLRGPKSSRDAVREETGPPFDSRRVAVPVRSLKGAKAMILRHKRLMAATAALVALAASLALYATHFSFSTPAYALEQTVQATQQVTSYHAKLSPGGRGMSEVWVQLHPDGTPLRARIDFPQTEDGAKVVFFSEGKAAVWFQDKNGYAILPEKNALDQVLEMQKLCDPRLAFEQLQARETAGKVKIETAEPTQEGEPIRLTVTSAEAPNQQEVYEVNPATKLAERVTYFGREGDQWKETKLIEYLDYNRPIDPKVFEPELPKDILISDQIRRPPGLVQGSLSDEEIAAKVAREFFEALIAKDYDKAGLLYEGIPAEKLKSGFEGRGLTITRIVEVGRPVLGMHPDPTAFAVPVKVECGGRQASQQYVLQVPLADNATAAATAQQFVESLQREDVAAVGQALQAGVVFEGVDATNAEQIAKYLEHYKIVRIVAVGEPVPHAESQRSEVPVTVELEGKGENVHEFRPYIRRVYNQPDRWGICGGI